jgi:hypothetical protein
MVLMARRFPGGTGKCNYLNANGPPRRPFADQADLRVLGRVYSVANPYLGGVPLEPDFTADYIIIVKYLVMLIDCESSAQIAGGECCHRTNISRQVKRDIARVPSESAS